MFLEKFQRYFKRYEICLGSRRKMAAPLPLYAPSKEVSVFDAIIQSLARGMVSLKQSNGDEVEIVSAEAIDNGSTIAILFHRLSPSASDPAYRKTQAGAVSVRTVQKEIGEEQSVSAHLLIRTESHDTNRYRATLEEVPGLSMGVVRNLIAESLRDYEYEYEHKGKTYKSYCTVKVEGIKSGAVSEALKKGKINFITFTRQAKPEYVDADGMLEPMFETMRLRVKGKPDPDNWLNYVKKLFDSAAGEGWEKFNVEISGNDNRTKTILIDREQDAKEVLFIKSDAMNLANAVPRCSGSVNSDIIGAGMLVLNRMESEE